MPFNRLLTKGFQRYWRYSRGLTLAVAVHVCDAGGRVLLVRTEPDARWRLPEGAALKGETAGDTVARCLAAGAGITITDEPRLFAIYAGAPHASADQIALYTVPSWRLNGDLAKGQSERRHAFFDAGQLPRDTSGAARARINDVRAGRQASELW